MNSEVFDSRDHITVIFVFSVSRIGPGPQHMLNKHVHFKLRAMWADLVVGIFIKDPGPAETFPLGLSLGSWAPPVSLSEPPTPHPGFSLNPGRVSFVDLCVTSSREASTMEVYVSFSKCCGL